MELWYCIKKIVEWLVVSRIVGKAYIGMIDFCDFWCSSVH